MIRIRTSIVTAIAVGACVIGSAAHAQKSGGGSTGSTAPADGVINIDQAKALAGSVTTGDAAGFPITISQPGSYRLTGPLVVPAGVHGIEVTSTGDITIDLNGFTITGPVLCTPTEYTVTCSPAANTGGIVVGSIATANISNGTVSGFGHGISSAGRGLRVANVTATSNSSIGIFSNGVYGALLERVHASMNGVFGIMCWNGVVVNSSFSHNGTASGAGVEANGCNVIDSVFRSNKGYGIKGNGLVRGNLFSLNVLGATNGPIRSGGGNFDSFNSMMF